MSGVPQRKRRDSALKYYANACQIEFETVRLMSSDRVIPKSNRFFVGIPAAEAAHRLVDNLERADSFFPNSGFNWEQRRMHLNLAKAECFSLLRYYQLAIDLDERAKASRFEEVTLLLEEEIRLIQGAYKNTRIIPGRGKTLDDMERAAEQDAERAKNELARLRESRL